MLVLGTGWLQISYFSRAKTRTCAALILLFFDLQAGSAAFDIRCSDSNAIIVTIIWSVRWFWSEQRGHVPAGRDTSVLLLHCVLGTKYSIVMQKQNQKIDQEFNTTAGLRTTQVRLF
jgi:hypothetical protein